MDGIEQAVIRVQAGEVEPYALIVEVFQKPIYRYCSRFLGSRSEAEDAVQDVLVKAYQNIGKYRPIASFSSWLYKIAYHHCLGLLRKRKRQINILTLFQPGPPAESPEQAMERRVFSEPLAVALSRLSPEERNLLVLRVFEEQSFPEIAGILDKNTEAVKKKYRRTLLKLSKMLEAQKGGSQWNGNESLLKKKM